MPSRSAVALAAAMALVSCGGPDPLDGPITTRTATATPTPSPTPAPTPSPEDSPSPTPKKSPPPAEDVSGSDLKKMAASFKAYVQAYNNGNYSEALAYIDPAAAADICGSGSAYAKALRETHDIENLDYSFIKLPLAVPEGKGRARADVSFDAFDPVTGEQIDFGAVIGLLFSKVGGDWLLAEEFPLGASSFC